MQGKFFIIRPALCRCLTLTLGLASEIFKYVFSPLSPLAALGCREGGLHKQTLINSKEDLFLGIFAVALIRYHVGF